MKHLFSTIKFASLFLLTSIIYSCDIDENSGRLLVKGSGTPGEIILVIDSVQWRGELGKVLKETLQADVPGVSRPEKLFTVRYIEPTLFNSVLNKARNIIFVATLDSKTRGGETVRNFMTDNYIQEHPDKFIISQKDIFASDQDVLYLFSATTDDLIERVRNNKETIRNFYNQKENERLLKSLFIAKEEKAVSKHLENTYGYSIRVPNGYRIETNEPKFMWLRSVGVIDKNIFITYTDYTNDKIFENSNLIGLRDSITQYNVFEDPADADSYMKVDTLHLETEYISTKFYGQYAKRIRGIWMANNLTIGGSFISYIFVDPDTNRLYFLDGFVVSPGKKKRETLRELEVILKTFSTVKEEPNKQST
jgi:hypothetical protein